LRSGISWPGGTAHADAADPGVVPKVKAVAKARVASSGGGKKKDMEKYSTSYSSIALVPAT